MSIFRPTLLAALALLVPSVACAEELATVHFDVREDYATCLDRAQAALENEGATTLRQAGDIVYGDAAEGLVGVWCGQGEAVAVATADGEQAASDWAARTRSAYEGLVEGR